MLAESLIDSTQMLTSGFMAVASAVAVYLGYRPIQALVLAQERQWGHVLKNNLLIDVEPRMVTVLTGVAMVVLGALG